MTLIPPPYFANPDAAGTRALEYYDRRYRKQTHMFSLIDWVISIFIKSKKIPLAKNPRNILLLNAGHIGDDIISTGLFPVLKHAFPDAKISFLTGEYCRGLLEGHPMLARTHFIDHWRAARGKGSRYAKAKQYYLHDLPKMVRELRREKYDVAVDLHAWFPNSVPLMWLAKIPVRIGFDRVGFGPLLTYKLIYVHDRRHELDHQLDLLRLWGVPEKSIRLARPVLMPITEDAKQEAAAVLGEKIRYRILHPASSTPTRDWIIENWITLAKHLIKDGITPVITGAGARDAEIAEKIEKGAPGVLNAVNRVSWNGLMALLEKAEMVYSVETSIGHAAGALGRPVISIYGAMADALHWGPLGAKIVTNPMPCAPCFNKHGCTHRSCILGITVKDVEAAADPI